MYPFWDVTSFILTTLAMKLSGLDKDGLNLRFTIRMEHVNNAKKARAPGKFEDAMSRAKPQESEIVKTNMAESLGRVLEEYLQARKGKRMTLIVLTDGVWPGSMREKSVERKIADFLKVLSQRHLSQRHQALEDRQYTIQFIRFGEDPRAIQRLNFLDNDFPQEYNIL